MNKVAQVTLAFWLMKICATTLGETAGDLFSMTLGAGYAVSSIVLLGLFAVALAVQMRARTFHPALYWTVVLLTSTAGTTSCDFMDRSLGLGYTLGSSLLFACLVLVLAAWRMTEGSLSVSDIQSPRAEAFYWAAILCSNTLGTALGDFLAHDSGLGFFGSATLIGALLAVVLAAYLFTSVDRVALFWAGFVLTRPFGATFGDLLTKPADDGGFDLGTMGSSAVLGAVLVALVGHASWRHAKANATA